VRLHATIRRNGRHRLSALRLGLNLLYLVPGETGGSEIYARQLVPELAALRPGEPIWVFASPELADELRRTPWCDGLRVVPMPVSGRTRVRRAGAEQALLPVAAARAGVTVLHSLATTAPAVVGSASVVTIHDLIYKRFPDTHAGLLSAGMALLVPISARRSTRIIAISDAVKADIVRYLDVPGEKVDVVRHGPGAEVFAAPSDEDDLRTRLALHDAPIVFSPSARRAHKNLDRLLDAFARVRSDPPPVLVIPGYDTGNESQLRARARTLGVEERLRLTRWLSQGDFEALYRAASFMVFPSLAEGFGLPVVEAMRRGTPVLCSTTPSLLELANGAALVVDPLSVDELAAAMGRLLADATLRADLADRGRERVKSLSWRRAARLTLASYEHALSGR
jgi:glycosyltransferase involved in cell wall biosynthesis